MRFCDLTKDQRTEVKQRLLCERLEKSENRTPSYGELVDRNFAKSKGRLEPIHWDEHCGIEWARLFLLAHIEAVRP